MVHHQVAEKEEGGAKGGLDDRAFVHAHDVIMVNDALVGVELASFFQNDRVMAPLGVGKLHAVAIGKGAGISHVSRLLEVAVTIPPSMPQVPARAILGPARLPFHAPSA